MKGLIKTINCRTTQDFNVVRLLSMKNGNVAVFRTILLPSICDFILLLSLSIYIVFIDFSWTYYNISTALYYKEHLSLHIGKNKTFS